MASTEVVRIVTIDLRENDEGLIVATCPELPSMFVVGKATDELAADISLSIEALWPHHYPNETVRAARVARADHDTPLPLGGSTEWAAIRAAA